MLNLGGLFFTLDADTRGLMTAQRRVEDFANHVRSAWRGVGRGTFDIVDARRLSRQEGAIVSAMERIKRAQESVSRADLSPRGAREAQVTLERLGGAFDNFTRKMAKPVPLNDLDFRRRVQHMNSQIVDATRNISRLQIESRRGTDILHGFSSASLLVQGHLGGMSTRFIALTALVRDFGGGIAIAAGTLGGLALGLGVLTNQTVRAGMALEAITAQLTAVSGNAAVAQYHIGFVKDVAQQAGIQFETTAKGFARFLVSAQAGGLTLQQTQEAFKGVALSAAVMQLSAEDTLGVMRALDQIMSKGTVQAEELRGQLGDRLPGAFVVAAAAMNVSTRELNKMLKAGDVVAAEFVPKFIAAYQKMLGIDPSAPIRTLRAELGRVGNEWTFFLQALNYASNATGTLAAAVRGLAQFLRMATTNIHVLIGAVGALTGAAIGLGIALAAPTIIGWARTLLVWINYLGIVARSTNMLTAANMALNAVLGANPLIRLLSILATLGTMLAGAYIGYNLLTGAIGRNNGAVDQSLDFWESYIDQQKRAGVQIRSVTRDIIQQAIVMAQQQANRLRATQAEMSSATKGPGLQDYLQAGNALRMGLGFDPSKQNRARQLGLAREVKEQATELNRMSNVLRGLKDVAALPELNAGAEAIGDLDKKAKGAQESVDGVTNRIKDLIDAASIARQQLATMMEPLAQGQDIRERMARLNDVGEAMRIVNNLSPKELGVAANLLGVPANVQAITTAIADLKGETRRAEDAVKDFVDTIGSIQRGERALAGFQRQLQYLAGRGAGIADPQQMKFFEELSKAEETLYNLSRTQEGQQALQRIVAYLQQIGVAGSNAAEMLANFNLQVSNAQEQIRFWDEHLRKMREVRNEVQDLISATSAYQEHLSGGLRDRLVGGFFGADFGEALEEATRRGREVANLAIQMHALGFSQQQINMETERYLELLRNLDAEKEVYDQIKAVAERTQNALRSMAMEGLSGLRSLLTGVDSLSDAIEKLGERLLDIAWQNFVVGPIEDWFSSQGRKRGNAGASGVDQQVVQATMNAILGLGDASKGTSQTMNTNLLQSIGSVVTSQFTQQLGTQAVTASMGQLAVSAAAAAAALAAMTAAAGGGGGEGDGGDGGSGWIGLIGKLVSIGLSNAPGRALGGNMLAGNLYSINEPGLAGEYFIPRVNGYMSNGRRGGGGSIYIDASTTIDARGATNDTVVELKREMAIRDARLRRELPYMIDARVIDSSGRSRY